MYFFDWGLFRNYVTQNFWKLTHCNPDKYTYVRVSGDYSMLISKSIALHNNSMTPSLHENCPNAGFFLVCIFPYLDWIRSKYLYSVRIRENTYQKYICIYIQSWKQCALTVITIMALWQLIHLSTWCTIYILLILLLWALSTLCVVDHLWPLIPEKFRIWTLFT